MDVVVFMGITSIYMSRKIHQDNINTVIVSLWVKLKEHGQASIDTNPLLIFLVLNLSTGVCF